jgi:hypothetical protein
MKVDMRIHPPIRDQVHAGLSALRVQGRQIWGDTRSPLPDIVIRLMVGVGDLARLARDRPTPAGGWKLTTEEEMRQIKKELGNIIDDLGLDVLECLDLAIEAQEKFAGSGRPR